jgi:hypothetical protein
LRGATAILRGEANATRRLLRQPRLNAIATTASDLVRALEPARLTSTPKLMLTALVERLGTPATGRRKDGLVRGDVDVDAGDQD